MGESTGQQTVVELAGLTCGGCERTVEGALLAVDGVTAASASRETQSAEVEFDPDAATIGDLRAAVSDAGFAPRASPRLVAIGPAGPEMPSEPAPRAPRPPAEVSATTFRISGMTCASCVATVERAVLRLTGVQSCEVALAEGSARVEHDAIRASPDAIIAAISSAGYKGAVETSPHSSADPGKDSAMTRRLAVSAALTLPLLVIAMSHGRLGIGAVPWLQFGLALPVLAYGGLPFYRAAWKRARHGSCDMSTLVTVGTLTAFAYSFASTAVPGWIGQSAAAPVYFETSAVIVTLVLLGRRLEERARHRTSDAIRRILALQAGSVQVRRGGTEVRVEPGDVRSGDEVVVRAGERIPVDGAVIRGGAAVDESPLTGESVPVDKLPGARVLSGSLNIDGHLAIRAEGVGNETHLARIVDFVRRAQASKSAAARLADRIAAVFVPAILAVAAVTLAAWLVAGPPQDRVRMAVNCSVSVLIIACPCALGLATPAALTVAIGRAAERAVLVRDGGALETARQVDTVVFDKTRTLTLGRLGIRRVATFGNAGEAEVVRAASAIEALVEHPVARAIADLDTGPPLQVEGFRALAGAGAEGEVDGRRWLLGKPELLSDRGVDVSAAGPSIERWGQGGLTTVLAARDGRLAGGFALSDTAHPRSREATDRLRKLGIRVLMLSGDSIGPSARMAAETGVDDVIAGALPVEKASEIRELQASGATVAMVGDGINDAPALAQANLGIAIGSGTDVAIESADIILGKEDPADVAWCVELGRRTQRTIRQNYAWAFGYNLIGVPVAAGLLYPGLGVLLSPVLASAAMALSSLSVLGNSLRLSRALSSQERPGAATRAQGRRP